MIALSLIPSPYRQILQFGLPVLLLAGTYGIGHHHGYRSRDGEVSALQQTIKDMRAASDKAKAENHAYVQRITTLQDQITKDAQNDYPQKLADARSALAAYVRLHPATYQSHAGQGGASAVSDTPGKSDEAPSQAVVSVADLDACAQSYVTATGLQDWIRKQQAVPREDAQHKDKPE